MLPVRAIHAAAPERHVGALGSVVGCRGVDRGALGHVLVGDGAADPAEVRSIEEVGVAVSAQGHHHLARGGAGSIEQYRI